jgi:hypothetical protein
MVFLSVLSVLSVALFSANVFSTQLVKQLFNPIDFLINVNFNADQDSAASDSSLVNFRAIFRNTGAN